jgi:hypothetical protein
MLRFKHYLVGTLFCVLSLVAKVQATSITYSLSQSGSDWTYSYTVNNDSLAGPIMGIDIFFPTEFSAGLDPTFPGGSVTGNSVPADWAGLPIDASANFNPIISFSTSGAGIAAGGSLTGFVATFTYSGPELLGSQEFKVYDADYNLLDAGRTVTSAVPDETPTALCALISIGGLALFRRIRAVAR